MFKAIKVKHSNCNSSPADCLISLKFDTEIYQVSTIHYKCTRSKVKGQEHSVT